MYAIKGRFDGEKVVIPEQARRLTPGEVIIVFVEGAELVDDGDSWARAQEAAFAAAWANDEDAAYDRL